MRRHARKDHDARRNVHVSGWNRRNGGGSLYMSRCRRRGDVSGSAIFGWRRNNQVIRSLRRNGRRGKLYWFRLGSGLLRCLWRRYDLWGDYSGGRKHDLTLVECLLSSGLDAHQSSGSEQGDRDNEDGGKAAARSGKGLAEGDDVEKALDAAGERSTASHGNSYKRWARRGREFE